MGSVDTPTHAAEIAAARAEDERLRTRLALYEAVEKAVRDALDETEEDGETHPDTVRELREALAALTPPAAPGPATGGTT